MNYKKYEKENYNMYLLKTDKFKTINVSFLFQRKNTQEEEIYLKLLKKILFLKTEKYNNIKEIALAACNIYSPNINLYSRFKPFSRSLELDVSFANEKYTEKGMNKKTLEFAMDFFWHPAIVNNGFDKELFELCRKELIDEIENEKNYPDYYSRRRIFELSDFYEFKQLTNEEIIEKLKEIDEFKLYEYYKTILNEDSLDIFIAGDVDDDIIEIISSYIYGDFKKSKLIKSRQYDEINLKKVVEKSDNPQSKLLLGYKIKGSVNKKEKVIASYFSGVLGAGSDSLLFKEVRTKRSLCYYINANYFSIFNFILISSGISAKNVDEVIELVKKEIIKIQNGEFSSERVEEIKKTMINALLEQKDSQRSILDFLILVIMEDGNSIDERMNIAKKITKDDIVEFSKRIELDTIFLLEGTE